MLTVWRGWLDLGLVRGHRGVLFCLGLWLGGALSSHASSPWLVGISVLMGLEDKGPGAAFLIRGLWSCSPVEKGFGAASVMGHVGWESSLLGSH